MMEIEMAYNKKTSFLFTYWQQLEQLIDWEKCKEAYSGLIIS